MGEPGARRRVRGRGDSGIALVLGAGVMVTLVVVAALVVDMGYAKQMRREAQASADAASLAAAQVRSTGGTKKQAAEAAREIAVTNFSDLTTGAWPSCTDPARPANYTVDPTTTTVTGQCVSFDETARLVRVVLPDVASPGFFGRVVDRKSYAVGAQAAATWGTSSSGSGTCGICGINGAEFAQDQSGHVDIEGGRMVQSDKLRITGQANSNKPDVLAWYLENNSENKKYTYQKLNQPVANPFAAVEMTYGIPISKTMNANCADLKPGEMYPQKVNISGSCTLAGGIYYFRNGINVSGSLKSSGAVTLVFGCATGTDHGNASKPCNGEHPGNLDVSGSLQLDAPAVPGISIFFDPTARGESVVNYNGNIKLGGAHYSANSTPMFNQGTFEATGVVFGGSGQRSYNNKGNIKITAVGDDSGAPSSGGIGLWR